MERFVILACLFVFAISGNVRSFGKHYNFDSRNRPAKYTIDTVPYHQQLTDYACGNLNFILFFIFKKEMHQVKWF
jgi:hypothetical protein